MAATPAWLAAIEALLNRGIAGSAQAAAAAQRLEGTALKIDIEGLTSVRAGVAQGRLGLTAVAEPAAGQPHDDAGVDATISGSPSALLRLARGVPAARSAGPLARVMGDAEIANSYRQLFAAARPDLEDELARAVGDFPARRLAQLAAQTMAWARKARQTAGENVAEYLQEESRDLVNKPELEEFLQGVDALRETADRIEARLSLLEKRLKSTR